MNINSRWRKNLKGVKRRLDHQVAKMNSPGCAAYVKINISREVKAWRWAISVLESLRDGRRILMEDTLILEPLTSRIEYLTGRLSKTNDSELRKAIRLDIFRTSWCLEIVSAYTKEEQHA